MLRVLRRRDRSRPITSKVLEGIFRIPGAKVRAIIHTRRADRLEPVCSGGQRVLLWHGRGSAADDSAPGRSGGLHQTGSATVAAGGRSRDQGGVTCSAQ